MTELINGLLDTIKQELQTNQFLSGGAILGLLTGILMTLKGIPRLIWSRIRRRIYYQVSINPWDDLYPYIQRWLLTNHAKNLRSVKATFYRVKERKGGRNNNNVVESGGGSEVRNYSEPNKIVYVPNNDFFRFWHKGRLITVSNQVEKTDSPKSMSQMFWEYYTFSGLFCHKQIHSLFDEIVSYNISKEEKDPPSVYMNSKYGGWDDSGSKLRDLSKVFIDNEVKGDIIDDITTFLNNEQFYYDRSIPYRRGYKLFGPPGNGKSSLVSAIAREFDLDIYCLNLHLLEDESRFTESLIYVKPNSILLIEEIDTLFNGREAKTKVNFSTFINAFSGVSVKHNVILFITTNKDDELDAALYRSGRIDKSFHIDKPSDKLIEDYFNFFFGTSVSLNLLNDNYSMADVENICVTHKFDYLRAKSELEKPSVI